MGLLDNLISTICPAYGFVKRAAEENPEAAKKVGKAAGKAVKTAADVAGNHIPGFFFARSHAQKAGCVDGDFLHFDFHVLLQINQKEQG